MLRALRELVLAVEYEANRKWWQQSYLPLIVEKMHDLAGSIRGI